MRVFRSRREEGSTRGSSSEQKGTFMKVEIHDSVRKKLSDEGKYRVRHGKKMQVILVW